jgi:hypothetical protein
MKTFKPFLPLVVACLFLTFFNSCKKDNIAQSFHYNGDIKKSFAITPQTFDWETVDWMPTPAGQTKIPPPWIGQGSIASTYGLDVISDHKKADGWGLVYNTFDPNASGTLINPYFILYNPYRGLMRIYFYVTTQFVYPSTYIVDGLTMVSSANTSMLNFLGADVVNYSHNKSNYSQIEPAPADGSQPLASNKWYMLQYELAYDPQIANLTSSNLQLSWFMNFNSVSTISLGGTATGTIKTAAGAATPDLMSALQNGAKSSATGVASIFGSAVLQNNKAANDTTGKNNMGLANSAFNALLKGTLGALGTLTGGIPGSIISGLFSAVVGGNSSANTINLNINTTITLNGTQTTAGSFPSSPTSMYVPGSIISATAQNYIPLYNNSLGVFNLSGPPQIICKYIAGESAITYYSLTPSELSGSNLVFNPAVLAIAKIQNIKEEVVLIDPQKTYPWTFNPQSNSYYGFPYPLSGSTGKKEIIGNHVVYTGVSFEADTQGYDYYDQENGGLYQVFNGMELNQGLGVRVQFDVVPNNGAPKSTIIKTFTADYYQSIIEQ